MKKVSLLIVGIITLLIIFGGFYFYRPSYNYSNELTNEKILNIIKPQINSYCDNLESKVTNSACPTCMFYYPEDKDRSYVYVSDFSEGNSDFHKYKVERTTEGYLITLQMHLIYGRNDRPGNQIISFNLDKNGQILNSDTPVLEC